MVDGLPRSSRERSSRRSTAPASSWTRWGRSGVLDTAEDPDLATVLQRHRFLFGGGRLPNDAWWRRVGWPVGAAVAVVSAPGVPGRRRRSRHGRRCGSPGTRGAGHRRSGTPAGGRLPTSLRRSRDAGGRTGRSRPAAAFRGAGGGSPTPRPRRRSWSTNRSSGPRPRWRSGRIGWSRPVTPPRPFAGRGFPGGAGRVGGPVRQAGTGLDPLDAEPRREGGARDRRPTRLDLHPAHPRGVPADRTRARRAPAAGAPPDPAPIERLRPVPERHRGRDPAGLLAPDVLEIAERRRGRAGRREGGLADRARRRGRPDRGGGVETLDPVRRPCPVFAGCGRGSR